MFGFNKIILILSDSSIFPKKKTDCPDNAVH